MISGIGTQELMIVGAIVLLIFGPKKVGPLLGSLGHGIRDFKQAISGKPDVPKVEAKDGE